MKNPTGRVLEKVFNNNPDLRLDFYSLQLYSKLILIPAFFRDKKQLPCSAHLLAFLISALINKKLPRVKLLISLYVCMYVFNLLSIILKTYKFLKDNNKNNYVCDVKYITTYTIYLTTRFQMVDIA